MRRRAYQGLAGYSLDALEEIGALRPLQDYAAPLLREADAGARAAAGALAADAGQRRAGAAPTGAGDLGWV